MGIEAQLSEAHGSSWYEPRELYSNNLQWTVYKADGQAACTLQMADRLVLMRPLAKHTPGAGGGGAAVSGGGLGSAGGGGYCVGGGDGGGGDACKAIKETLRTFFLDTASCCSGATTCMVRECAEMLPGEVGTVQAAVKGRQQEEVSWAVAARPLAVAR